MTARLFHSHLLPSMLLICIFLPGTGLAQVPSPDPNCTAGPGSYGPYQHKHKYIPKPPPNWRYYGLPNGPELTIDYPFMGWPGYRGAFGSFFTNGPHLSRTPVPVYTPIPDVFTHGPHVHPLNQRKRLLLGLGYYGWIGPYAASPRPKPVSVNVWSPADPRAMTKHGRYAASGTFSTTLPAPALPPSGEHLTLSVKVPHTTADVYVEGVKTTQTGTDRLFESPPLDAGKQFRYELIARWVEDGVRVERKKVVTGKPGEVITVDFNAPEVVLTGR